MLDAHTHTHKKIRIKRGITDTDKKNGKNRSNSMRGYIHLAVMI